MKFKLVESIILEADMPQEPELHIYADKGGKFYIFDGTNLIEVSKGQLGQTIRELEGQPLPHEREDNYGPGSIPGDGVGANDTVEERDLDSLWDLYDTDTPSTLDDEDFIQDLLDDEAEIRRGERPWDKRGLYRTLKSNEDIAEEISTHIKDFISKQLRDTVIFKKSWRADKNAFTDDKAAKVRVHGHQKIRDIPIINMYMDASGSCQTQEVRNLLDQCASAFAEFEDLEHPEKSKIMLNKYYFGDTVSDNPKTAGGGTQWDPVKKHIEETQPDNVLILTDDGVEGQHGGKSVEIPGALWCIYVNTIDGNMLRDWSPDKYRYWTFNT